MSSTSTLPTPDLDPDLVWGIAGIAAAIGRSQTQVFHQLANGLLPARKVGRTWVASRAQLAAAIEGKPVGVQRTAS